MMYDPPDFPFRELCDTLPDAYDTDDLLMTNPGSEPNNTVSTAKSLAEVTELMISSVENQLLFTSNESGSYFNAETKSYFNVSQTNVENSTTLYTVQPADNLFNYEPTLLDENTVNQFLLPLHPSTDDKNKDAENNGPDLLSLHSCVVCHDIFTSDSDLLDHTVLVHASVDAFQPNPEPVAEAKLADVTEPPKTTEGSNDGFDIDADWMVCSMCSRVLSTALEVEPTEQLCCVDGEGKGAVSMRKLHTMYVCDCCNGLFADVEALNGHSTTCFPQDSNILYTDMENPPSFPPHPRPEAFFPCSTCSAQYPTPEELRAHLAECRPRRSERRPYHGNTNKMWNCGSCNQLFATARELYRHKRGEDRPEGAPLVAHVCDHCDKVLGSMCALHTHKKMHKVSKPGYPCRVCGRRFNQSGHLAIHMRMHTGERPYPCDLCPKAFKVKVERDDHRRTHTGERPFACAACPKTFTAAARLREHARIHTDQRPYSCEICGAAFRRPYARTVHTLIHTGEKPHACDICGTAFRRSGDMWKHKRTLHGIQAGQD